MEPSAMAPSELGQYGETGPGSTSDDEPRRCSSSPFPLRRAYTRHSPWSPEEELLIVAQHCKHGSSWRTVAEALSGRSANDVKNVWHSTLRSKKPGTRSLLRAYQRELGAELGGDGPSDPAARAAALQRAQARVRRSPHASTPDGEPDGPPGPGPPHSTLATSTSTTHSPTLGPGASPAAVTGFAGPGHPMALDGPQDLKRPRLSGLDFAPGGQPLPLRAGGAATNTTDAMGHDVGRELLPGQRARGHALDWQATRGGVGQEQSGAAAAVVAAAVDRDRRDGGLGARPGLAPHLGLLGATPGRRGPGPGLLDHASHGHLMHLDSDPAARAPGLAPPPHASSGGLQGDSLSVLDALRMLLPQLPQALQQQAAGGGGGGPGPGLGSGSGGAAAATASPYRESRRLGSVLAAAGDRGHLLSDECSGLADALGGGRLRPNESDSNSASTAPTFVDDDGQGHGQGGGLGAGAGVRSRAHGPNGPMGRSPGDQLGGHPGRRGLGLDARHAASWSGREPINVNALMGRCYGGGDAGGGQGGVFSRASLPPHGSAASQGGQARGGVQPGGGGGGGGGVLAGLAGLLGGGGEGGGVAAAAAALLGHEDVVAVQNVDELLQLLNVLQGRRNAQPGETARQQQQQQGAGRQGTQLQGGASGVSTASVEALLRGAQLAGAVAVDRRQQQQGGAGGEQRGTKRLLLMLSVGLDDDDEADGAAAGGNGGAAAAGEEEVRRPPDEEQAPKRPVGGFGAAGGPPFGFPPSGLLSVLAAAQQRSGNAQQQQQQQQPQPQQQQQPQQPTAPPQEHLPQGRDELLDALSRSLFARNTTAFGDRHVDTRPGYSIPNGGSPRESLDNLSRSSTHVAPSGPGGGTARQLPPPPPRLLDDCGELAPVDIIRAMQEIMRQQDIQQQQQQQSLHQAVVRRPMDPPATATLDLTRLSLPLRPPSGGVPDPPLVRPARLSSCPVGLHVPSGAVSGGSSRVPSGLVSLVPSAQLVDSGVDIDVEMEEGCRAAGHGASYDGGYGLYDSGGAHLLERQLRQQLRQGQQQQKQQQFARQEQEQQQQQLRPDGQEGEQQQQRQLVSLERQRLELQAVECLKSLQGMRGIGGRGVGEGAALLLEGANGGSGGRGTMTMTGRAAVSPVGTREVVVEDDDGRPYPISADA